MYDVIVIGGGPAGFTAGLFSKWFGLNTLVLSDPEMPSQLMLASTIENYPSVDSVSGTELLSRMRKQTEKLGVMVKDEKVSAMKDGGKSKKIITDKGEYDSKALIIATGAKHRSGGIPGEKEFMGRGVSYCATCDGHFFKGKNVIVWGGGDTAMKYAVHLQTIGCKTTLVHRRKDFRASEYNVEQAKKLGVKFILEKSLVEIKGDKLVKSVIMDDKKEVPTSAVFVAIGEVPSVEIVKSVGVKVTEANFIEVDKQQKTNVPGVFAAGDVTTTSLRQVAVSVGEGAIAAKSALDYVQSIKK